MEFSSAVEFTLSISHIKKSTVNIHADKLSKLPACLRQPLQAKSVMANGLKITWLLALFCLWWTWIKTATQNRSFDQRFFASILALVPFVGILFWGIFYLAPPAHHPDQLANVSHHTGKGALVAREMQQQVYTQLTSGGSESIWLTALFSIWKIVHFIILPALLAAVLFMHYFLLTEVKK